MLHDRRRRHVVPLVASIIATSACGGGAADAGGDGPPTSPDLPARLTILRGAGGSAEVDRAFGDTLVVQVTKAGGGPAGNVAVQFSVPTVNNELTYPVVFAGGSTMPRTSSIATNTDAAGRARVVPVAGTRTGQGVVTISVPSLNLQATSGTFTATPGALAGVSFPALDRTAIIGSSFDGGATAVDRYGNTRPEPVTYTGGGSGVSVSASGAVTATAFGRGFVVASHATHVDTMWVSAVPRLEMAVASGDSVGTMLVDGTGWRGLDRGRQHVKFARDGSSIAYLSPAAPGLTDDIGLLRLGTGAASRPFSRAGAGSFVAPVLAPAADRVYVTATPAGENVQRVLSMPADGGAPLRLDLALPAQQHLALDVSADGTMLLVNAGRMHLVDLATNATREIPGAAATMASLSPDGRTVYFVAQDGVAAIGTDGSNRRVVHPWNGTPDVRRFAVSGDGQWALVLRGNGLAAVLIRLADGAAAPVVWTRSTGTAPGVPAAVNAVALK